MQFNESFWVALSFILFIGFVFKYIKKALNDFTANRTESIKNRLDEAEALKQEAEKLLAEHKSLHKNAKKEAEELSLKATKEIEYLKIDTEKHLKETLDLRKAAGMSRIKTYELKLLHQMRMKAVHQAIENSITILTTQDFTKTNTNLVNDAISKTLVRLS